MGHAAIVADIKVAAREQSRQLPEVETAGDDASGRQFLIAAPFHLDGANHHHSLAAKPIAPPMYDLEKTRFRPILLPGAAAWSDDQQWLVSQPNALAEGIAPKPRLGTQGY